MPGVADYPPIEPYDHGMLDVGDGNLVYWETCGRPDGLPALVVHGGPGSGCSASARRGFDPLRYRAVLFDQRGCGRSTPHASDPATDLRHNTTNHLVADMERLREHLGVEQWLLFGGSWGSTLALAYAQRHPARVSAIVIPGVTTTRRSEIDWLYRGVARFFPAQWELFRVGATGAAGAVAAGTGTGPANSTADLLAAYARLVEDPDPQVRTTAADAWCAWEDAVISLEPNGRPNAYGNRPPAARLALVRLCAHYFSHAAWLDDDELLRGAERLTGIPGTLIHGRHDLSSPIGTAWKLARAWPGATLVQVSDAGHTGSPTMRDAIRRTLDEYALARSA